mgnify:CR=1 FL=1
MKKNETKALFLMPTDKYKRFKELCQRIGVPMKQRLLWYIDMEIKNEAMIDREMKEIYERSSELRSG